MADFNKFQSFVGELGLGSHDLNADTLKCVLTNTVPVATEDVLGEIAQIANGNGYTTGGEDTQNTFSESGGTATLTGTKIVWTSSGAGMANFRYVVLYNDSSATSPDELLIGWWDYASELDLGVGETFTVKFSNGDPTGTILTIV